MTEKKKTLEATTSLGMNRPHTKVKVKGPACRLCLKYFWGKPLEKRKV